MKRDMKNLQGTWNVVSLEMEGRKLAEGTLTGAKIVVEGTHFTSVGMGMTYEGKIEIDSSTKPKSFNLVFEAGPEKGNTNLGIYEVDGDTWKMCLATRGSVRPKKFESGPGSGFALETLKRLSLTAAERSNQGASLQTVSYTQQSVPEFQAGPSELEGEWSMLSGIMSGQPMDPDGVKYGRRITRGNETTVLFGPQIYFKARVVIDTAKTPKTMDYFYTEGPNKDRTQPGIYELDGTTVKICVAGNDQERPVDFTTKPGDGKTLTSWKLAKK